MKCFENAGYCQAKSRLGPRSACSRPEQGASCGCTWNAQSHWHLVQVIAHRRLLTFIKVSLKGHRCRPDCKGDLRPYHLRDRVSRASRQRHASRPGVPFHPHGPCRVEAAGKRARSDPQGRVWGKTRLEISSAYARRASHGKIADTQAVIRNRSPGPVLVPLLKTGNESWARSRTPRHSLITRLFRRSSLPTSGRPTSSLAG